MCAKVAYGTEHAPQPCDLIYNTTQVLRHGHALLYVTPWRHALRQEAEVVAVLLCQPDQRGAQRLGRLLDEGLKVDDVVTRLVRIELGLFRGLGLGLGL